MCRSLGAVDTLPVVFTKDDRRGAVKTVPILMGEGLSCYFEQLYRVWSATGAALGIAMYPCNHGDGKRMHRLHPELSSNP